MKIDILSLFPEMFEGFLNTSIIKRAINNKSVEINIIDFRKFSDDPNHKVDDYSFGGGFGMVLKIEPIYRALQSIKTDDSFVIMLTPQGKPYQQKIANELKIKKHLIFVCGHYEGFDERIRSLVDLELSIGDYILTGGELPSMVIADSIIRLLPSVIKEESHLKESYQDNLLDYPVYTHPRDFMGMLVPDVLLSGNHKEIDKWRLEEQIKRTKERRPDLLDRS